MKERSKLPLILTELALMLLVFSICSAVCLSVFAESRKTARESGELGNAAAWAQSAAEVYRSVNGEAEKAAELIGAEISRTGFQIYFNESWEPTNAANAAYTLVLSETGAAQAKIEVTDGAETLFSLEVKAVADYE